MIEDFLGAKELKDISKEEYIDMNVYYIKNKTRDIIRKIFNKPFRQGEFYYSYSKKDDFIRRSIAIKHTKKNKNLVKYYQDKNKLTKERPEKCDMITSAPCTWSKTHWSNERCDKCGYVFPEWN